MKTLVIAYVVAAALAAPALLWAADEAAPVDPATATATTAAEPPPVTPVGPAEEYIPKAEAAVTGGKEDVVEKTDDLKPKSKPKAKAAATSSVTIKGFKYSPATVTVDKGDTVTWTNQDTAPHTATKTSGSGAFDTGNLTKGQSGSHKFSEAGTFNYICAIHPNMEGKVVVKASSSSSGGSSSGSDSSSSDSSSSDSSSASDDAFQLSDSSSDSGSSDSSSSDSSLASTGGNIGLTLMLGLGLLGAGAVMRRRTA